MFWYGHTFSTLWSIYLWMKLLGHMATLSLTFQGMTDFFQAAIPLYMQFMRVPIFLYILQHLFSIFYHSHTSECEVVYLCDLHLPDGQWCWESSYVPIGHTHTHTHAHIHTPMYMTYIFQYVVVLVQLLSCVQLFVTPRAAACQALLSSTLSQSLLKFISIELVMPPNHLILYHPLFLWPTIFPSIRSFPVSRLFTWGV